MTHTTSASSATTPSRASPPRRQFRSGRGSTVAWLALVLAASALILSLIAFNRTGGDLNTVLTEQIDSLRTELAAAQQAAADQAERFENFVQESGAAVEAATDTTPPEEELAAARTAAAVRLAAIDLSDASESAYQAARQEVARAREELSEAYAATGQEASENWQELEATLGQIETDLEARSEEVGFAIRELALRLDPDVN